MDSAPDVSDTATSTNTALSDVMRDVQIMKRVTEFIKKNIPDIPSIHNFVAEFESARGVELLVEYSNSQINFPIMSLLTIKAVSLANDDKSDQTRTDMKRLVRQIKSVGSSDLTLDALAELMENDSFETSDEGLEQFDEHENDNADSDDYPDQTPYPCSPTLETEASGKSQSVQPQDGDVDVTCADSETDPKTKTSNVTDDTN
jgi:hypothetical protein